MKIHGLSEPPSRELALALADFETEFTYPLGPGRSFSISHSPDYSLFFRSMGETRIYLAEISGKIVGSLAVVRRTVILADGTTIPAVYLCDAKVTSEHRGRSVLGRLILQARDETMAAGYHAAYSVVMTGSTPSDTYTGRLGVPQFKAIGNLEILRFDTQSSFNSPANPALDQHDPFHRIQVGNPSITSAIQPHTLEVKGARGTLLDTRAGKRLWQSDGHEMISAHLTELFFESSQALLDLIVAAVEEAGKLGFPGLFTSLPAGSPALSAIIESATLKPVVAQATVFGTGLPEGLWMINTSEI